MGLLQAFGLQGDIKDEINPEAEAIASIALAAIASDGYLSAEETKTMSSSLSRMKLFQTASDESMRKLFDKLLNILRNEGVDSLLQSTTVISSDLKTTAFAIAADLVLADSIETVEEEAFLAKLATLLNVSDELASQIIEVMLIKNRG